MMPSRMQQTVALGADFWNDSCDLKELGHAVQEGASGATSNPVIVATAIKSDQATWVPVLDALVADFPHDTEDDVAWKLIEAVGKRAAALLHPVFEKTRGKKGYLSMQVNPKLYRDPARMLEHGRRLAAVAPNVAIKVPATAEGIEAGSALVAEGINVNATVSFTVPQAVYVAQAFERALDRARAAGREMERLHPYVTLMVGRLDDHLQRVMAREAVTIEPGFLHWAGVAVFKRAHRLFVERGYRSTLLSAAYRHHLHWSELAGPGVILTMPYAWWNQFNASDVEITARLDEPVDARVLDALQGKFKEFRRAYDEDGLKPEEFVRFGATIHTLNQFLGGYQDLLGFVRERMLR
jgi:transaldolase